MTPQHYSFPKGVTLIELTVVISMIFTLVSTLFISAGYYRNSANRAACVTQISQIQKGLRSYQNLNMLSPGDRVSPEDFIGPDKLIKDSSVCPRNGEAYEYYGAIPPEGVAFAKCRSYGAGSGNCEKDEHYPSGLDATW